MWGRRACPATTAAYEEDLRGVIIELREDIGATAE